MIKGRRMTVQELFLSAIVDALKDERRNSFKKLRRVSLYGEPDEAKEAKFAIEHSAEYERRLEAAWTSS